MRSSLFLALTLAALAPACDGRSPAAPTPAAAASSAPPPAGEAPPAAPSAASPPASASAAPSRPLSLDDAAFGALVGKLSEKTGKFPSDNLVSNETSYLHVASDLSKPSRAGGVYIGVGPEQSFTYLAMLRPSLAFIVDIRRDNMVQHLVFKVLFEQNETRQAFVCEFFSREPAICREGEVGALFEAIKKARPSAARSRALEASVAARAAALGIALDADDKKHLRFVVDTFAKEGPGIHYTMEGSSRRYPGFDALMTMRDEAGAPRSFVATDEAYAAVRAMQRENRVVPVVGDLAGEHALTAIASETRARGEQVKVLYASNVEQYLFSPASTWQRWLKNLEAMPWADDAALVRVYFDQGKAHPQQQQGHRTTSMLRPARAFVERAKARPFASWFDVATWGG